MECDKAREAISALIDGEDAGLPDGALEAHLAGCAACREWQHRAHAVTRRARLGSAFLDHDLAPGVLAAISPSPAKRRLRLGQRATLLVAALAQLAITVPCLILGKDHDAGVHAAHELGSFDLALAIAFAVGAIRPRLSAGLAWPCGIAAAGLVGTAILDLFSGQTLGADEAQHLVAVLGAALLFWQARTGETGNAGPAAGVPFADAGIGRTAGADPVFRIGRPPHAPGGGTDVARVAGQEPAALADASPALTGHADGAEAVA
jgi:predicted anti-sigma-YlaC factor YlaD